MDKLVTLKIKPETRERLKKLATKAETYDDFLHRLMDLYERREA